MKVICLSLLVAAVAVAVKVPQVKLCDSDDCPVVSRIGLGTLHLSDKIGGLQTSVQVNEWIRNGLSSGINLFDCADVVSLIHLF